MAAPGGGGLLVLKADDTVFEAEINGVWREIPGIASMRETVGEPETTSRLGFRGRTTQIGDTPDSTMVVSGSPAPHHLTYLFLEKAEESGTPVSFRATSQGVKVHDGVGNNKVSWADAAPAADSPGRAAVFAGEDPSTKPLPWFVEGATIQYTESGATTLVVIDRIKVNNGAAGTHHVYLTNADGTQPAALAAAQAKNYIIASPPEIVFSFAARPGRIPKMDRAATGGEDVSFNLFLQGKINQELKAFPGDR